MNLRNVNKGGEVVIIGTVLLILAVVVSGGIVAYYTIQQASSVDASCLEVLNGIEFASIGYSCRLPDAPEGALTSFSVKISDDRIDGFQVGIERDGTTQTYEVTSGKSYNELCILGSDFAQPLSAPAAGDTRTYVAQGDVRRIFIAPILKGGKGCYAEARKDATIANECVNPAVESEMIACLNVPGTTCGNGVVESGEACDDGMFGANDDTYYTVNPSDNDGTCVIDQARQAFSCRDNVCGDGYLKLGEACDDGNTANDDGCSGTCTIETCSISNVRWNAPFDVYEDRTVGLLADVVTCGGESFSFAVKEDDAPLGPGGTDSNAVNQPDTILVSRGATGIRADWVAEWASDSGSGETAPPEYYFELTHRNRVLRSSIDLSYELKVRACGDLIIDNTDGEDCDGATLGGATCSSVSGGTLSGNGLACYLRSHVAECKFDVRACIGIAVCGNGLVESGEACDDGNTANDDGCSQMCQKEPGWICEGQPSICTRCGNGQLEAGEECDYAGPVFGNGVSCTTFGRPGGQLACTKSCAIDLSKCSLCGDETIGAGEACDPPGSVCVLAGGGSSGQGICSELCTSCEQPPAPVLDPPRWSQTGPVPEGTPVSYTVSGTNVATLPLVTELWEDDPFPFSDDLIQTIPAQFDFFGSPVIIQDVSAPWQCDILFGILCDVFEGVQSEFYVKAYIQGQSTTEVISSTYLITTEGSPTCGNGLVQGSETCDPPESPCTPFYGGSCTYCSGACSEGSVLGGFCGNRIIEFPEEVCDDNTRLCTTDQGYSGLQSCSGNCLFYGSCAGSQFCGDGARNGPEVCDGSDLNGQSCASLGFTGGALVCLAGCGGFDTSQCTTNGAVCGNGQLEAGEACDPPGSVCLIEGSTGETTITGGVSGSPSGGSQQTGQQGLCSGDCTLCAATP